MILDNNALRNILLQTIPVTYKQIQRLNNIETIPVTSEQQWKRVVLTWDERVRHHGGGDGDQLTSK